MMMSRRQRQFWMAGVVGLLLVAGRAQSEPPAEGKEGDAPYKLGKEAMKWLNKASDAGVGQKSGDSVSIPVQNREIEGQCIHSSTEITVAIQFCC